MRVLLLSPYPENLRDVWTDETIVSTAERITPEFAASFDLGVSYGYRHILKASHLAMCPFVNLHIAYLPWNRGADPNLWSWIENTPKGVTVHWIDEGIDTGDIIAQRLVPMEPEDTLATSYERLHRSMVELFQETWPHIRSGTARRFQQNKSTGSFHRVRDRREVEYLATHGFETPVKQLRAPVTVK